MRRRGTLRLAAQGSPERQGRGHRVQTGGRAKGTWTVLQNCLGIAELTELGSVTIGQLASSTA